MQKGVEATLTQPRTYLEIQLSSGEITQNKQLNKSKRKASKTCKHGERAPTQPPTHAQQKTTGGGQSDPQLTSWWEGPTKKDPTTIKTQRYTQSQYKQQPKSSKFRRSRRLHH